MDPQQLPPNQAPTTASGQDQTSSTSLPQQAPTAGQSPPTNAPRQAPVPPLGMPQIADDTDLIEKEWVDKAKEIVEQTAHDPHLQNQELTKVKVDYLKKRYNKDLKITDD